MDLKIAGKVALVCGASKGFGRATAALLAAEGCHVVMCARHEEPLQAAATEIQAAARATHADVTIVPVVADIAQAGGCEHFVQTALDRFGQIDILITNTGGPTPGDFQSITEQDWHAALDSTLFNVVCLVKLCLPTMKQHGGGRIVNITSVSAKSPIDGLTLSNTIRPGLVGLCKTLALELAGDNILVNNVCPGSHMTDRLRELAEVRAEKAGTTADEQLKQMAAAIPLGRLGDPEELAATIVYLCSEPASFITGQSIVVDGGTHRGL